jgi:excisionase family DNA binding protein
MSAAELLSQLTDALAEEVAAKASGKLLAHLNAHRIAAEPDPLLTIVQAAKHLGKSPMTVRRLVEAGELPKARGMKEINIRRSVLDKYGKTE